MNEKSIEPRSILEDIFVEMFNIIEEKGLFNKEEIQRLKVLANQDNFREVRSIIKIIESKLEEQG